MFACRVDALSVRCGEKRLIVVHGTVRHEPSTLLSGQRVAVLISENNEWHVGEVANNPNNEGFVELRSFRGFPVQPPTQIPNGGIKVCHLIQLVLTDSGKLF
jgi:hypothetical protein